MTDRRSDRPPQQPAEETIEQIVLHEQAALVYRLAPTGDLLNQFLSRGGRSG